MLKTIKHTINVVKSALRDVGVSKKRSSLWGGVKKHFLKDNPECAVCGSKKRLNVHHKKPFHLYPELELDPNNLITLCMSRKECHLVIGHGSHFSAYNPQIEKDVKILQDDISKFAEVKDKAKNNRIYE